MIDGKIDSNEGINWAITLKNNAKLIGIIGHYMIKPEHYRDWIYVTPRIPWKGIVSEAVKNGGFEVMKLHSIEAVLDPENYGSAKF
jgi:ribosomal-protein-alanine N-acetyltransferase